MPTYKKDINYIVQAADVDAMLARTNYQMHRGAVACLYLTGARPSEVVGLHCGDINIVEDSVSVHLKTLKLGKSGGFMIRSRTLEFSKDAPYMTDMLKQVELALQANGIEGLVFPIGRRQLGKLVEKLSEGRFCPYNFRHSRLAKLANEDCTLGELMSWKGARDARSVGPYLAGKKIGRRLKVT
jgi:integrase